MQPSTVKTNAELAAEMARQMADYLAHGGQVSVHAQGDTAFSYAASTPGGLTASKKAMMFITTRRKGGAK